MGNIEVEKVSIPLPTFPQGANPVRSFIPVARIADMLLKPGAAFEYNGTTHHYPDIRLVYWSGGNPFHHHQDIGKLRQAFGRPETIVVHEPYWTATARCADIVLPSTILLERNDIGAARSDPYLIAMKQALPRYADARDDYEIFSMLAVRSASRSSSPKAGPATSGCATSTPPGLSEPRRADFGRPRSTSSGGPASCNCRYERSRRSCRSSGPTPTLIH